MSTKKKAKGRLAKAKNELKGVSLSQCFDDALKLFDSQTENKKLQDTFKTKDIAILCFYQKTTMWDQDSENDPIGGSEEAVINMCRILTRMGHRVFVFGNPPRNSRYLKPGSNPRYAESFDYLVKSPEINPFYPDNVTRRPNGTQFDHVICWRHCNFLEASRHSPNVYLWLVELIELFELISRLNFLSQKGCTICPRRGLGLRIVGRLKVKVISNRFST
jgi:hypothetical protein